MLLELTIRNFAIIDELHLRWEPGLNVLTGETGAGKSIVLDAVGGLLGDRLGAEVVRTGAERAYVEGVFTIAPGDAALRQLLAEHDLLDAEDQLIVSRDIARTGRSVGRVNGRAVSLALLQAIGERLVDVHGQSQHLSLLRGRAQLDLLDHYAGLES
ncbi:MAG TPA: AAA family ATPase, partial [Chloroflexota bacterium]